MTTLSDVARAHAAANPNHRILTCRGLNAGLHALHASGRVLLVILATVCATAWGGSARADDEFKLTDGEFGINLYGLSYHFNQARARQLGDDNQFNPGLGVRYRFAEWKRWSFFVDGGVFQDSGRNAAKLLGTAATWDFRHGFRAGGALVFFNSDTYNNGRSFVAPLPLLSYDIGRVTLNATFFPRVAAFNEIATIGFWITFWPKR